MAKSCLPTKKWPNHILLTCISYKHVLYWHVYVTRRTPNCRGKSIHFLHDPLSRHLAWHFSAWKSRKNELIFNDREDFNYLGRKEGWLGKWDSSHRSDFFFFFFLMIMAQKWKSRERGILLLHKQSRNLASIQLVLFANKFQKLTIKNKFYQNQTGSSTQLLLKIASFYHLHSKWT